MLFRRFHPIVIPKIPSQNILSISDRERNTGRRVIAFPRAEATKKTSKIYNGNKSNKLLFITSVQCANRIVFKYKASSDIFRFERIVYDIYVQFSLK